MHQLVVRPLLVFITFLLLVFALMQTLGRVAMWGIDGFQGPINALLEDQQIVLSGLTGDWQRLNPVLRINEVRLPAGSLEDVLVELDVLESMVRNRPVMQRLFVGGASIEVERTDQGWWLAGMVRRESEFDVVAMLTDSDELRIVGNVAVRGAPDAALTIDASGINRGGMHWYDAAISRADCVPAPDRPCRLSLRWRAQGGVWPVYDSAEWLALSGAVDVPGAFTDWLGLASGLRVDVDGQWLRDAGSGGGDFSLQIGAIGLPGGVAAAVKTEVHSLVVENVHDGSLIDLTLTAADQRLELGTVAFRGGVDGLELWTEQLQLGLIGEFLTGALRGVDVAHRWLDALQVKGRAHNVRANVAPDGLSYAATLDGIELEFYKGVPRVRHAAGEIFGFERGAALSVNAETLDVHFADTFDEGWQLDNVQGMLFGWFKGNYFGLRAPHIRAETGASRSVGSFSLTRPPGYYDQRLALQINVDRIGVLDATTFLPFRLPGQLKQWLDQGPRGGELVDASFAFQGQVHTQPDDQSRRIELEASLENGKVSYDPKWPVVTGVQAKVTVAGRDVFADVRSAKSMGGHITNTQVHLFDNGAYAEVDLHAEVDAGVGMSFVRGSPLQEWMAFVTPAWDGSGSLSLEGQLFIPISEALADQSVDVALDLTLADVALEIPDYRLSLRALHGTAHYQYPHYLTSDTLAGDLFGRPVTISAAADDDSVDFRINGSATPADVYQLANMRDYGLAQGLFPFSAELSIAVDDQASQLMANTGLVGLTIDLPGEFAKAADVARSTELNLQFLDTYTAMQIRHGNVNAWFHVEDVPLRGAIGVGTTPPMVAATADEVIISGHLTEVDLNEWVQNAGGLQLPIPWRLQRVLVDRARIENTVFDQVSVDGTSRDGVMELQFAAADVNGRFVEAGDVPLELYFKDLRLPDGDGEGDPFDVSVIDKLPEANVTIDTLTIGEDDFGSWMFTIRNRDDGVSFGDLSANLKGTAITAPEGVFWSRADNRSRMQATLTMENLADVLPLWDYASSVESETASLVVDASWPGSPLNVEINGLRGGVVFKATNGSFLEIAPNSSAQRILSLLNFSTITKRLNFDFSDVVGKGVSFDTIDANTRFDEGTMVFVDPMEVKGSGSDFSIGGRVNFKDDLIAADMIVTLPVSESLPWYAAYVALANPLLGLGVLVGQQVLKQPLRQLSSARYEITGSLSDPQVNFVEMFGTKIQTAEEALEDEESVVREGGP